MKIHYTLSIREAEQKLIEKYGQEGGYGDTYEVTISEPATNPTEQRSVPISSLISIVRQYRYTSDQKIAAIKAIREHMHDRGFYVGLAEAKAFVEALPSTTL
jgi:ribosomal protein L7/L12